MLDKRAEYDFPPGGESVPALTEGGLDGFRNSPVPVRTRPVVAAVWIFPHETASRDYFWGGWISVVTDEPQWILTKPGKMPKAPGVVNAGQGGPAIKNGPRAKRSVPVAAPAPANAPASAQP